MIAHILTNMLFFLADFVGWMFYCFDKKHRKIALDNLRISFPDISKNQRHQICREVFQHLAKVFVERLCVGWISFNDLKKNAIWEGEEIIKSFNSNEGCLYLTGHLGSWEMFTVFGPKFSLLKSVLVRKMKYPIIEKFLTYLREKDGCQVVWKGQKLKKILASLKKGQRIGILNDQDAGYHGVFIPFMGRMASMHKGMVSVAIKEQVPIYPIFLVREKNWKFRIIVFSEIQYQQSWEHAKKIKYVLTQYASILESVICRYPSQWLWLHRRWKTQPKNESH